VQLNNAVEKFEVRRHPHDIDLLYILAERNSPSLIRVHRRDHSVEQRKVGRYGNPFFAAIMSNRTEALDELFQCDQEAKPDGCNFPDDLKSMVTLLVKKAALPLTVKFLSVYKVDLAESDLDSVLARALHENNERLIDLLLA